MMMKQQFFIYLLIVFSSLIILKSSSQSISNNGITITSIDISNQILNWTTPITPSTTFIIGVELENSGISIENGYITFNDGDAVLPYSLGFYQQNFFNQSSNGLEFSVRICIPVDVIGGCGIQSPRSEIECIYSIRFVQSPTLFSEFSYIDIKNTFNESSLLKVTQNVISPILIDFSIHINPMAPLVSFELGVDYFGRGLYLVEITWYYNGNFTSFLTISSPIITNNGYYYLEELFQPEVTGYNYTLVSLYIEDDEGNTNTYTGEDLSNQFKISSFQLKKSSEELDFKLFNFFVDVDNPLKATGSTYSNLKANAYLHRFDLPTICMRSVFSVCALYYRNSTWVMVYSQVLPMYTNMDDNTVNFLTMSSYALKMEFISIDYINSVQLPTLSDISYSISVINQLEPFYIEMNFTTETIQAFLYQIYFDVFVTISAFASNAQISGNSTHTVMSSIWYLDSYYNSLTDYTLYVQDSKSEVNIYMNTKGPVTTPRVPSNSLSIDLIYNSMIFDLRNSTSSSIPFLISTSSNDGNSLSYTYFSDLVNNIIMVSGETTYQSLNSQIIFGNSTNAIYNTYVTMYRDSLINGDFLLQISYFGETSYSTQTITDQCFTVIQPDYQPTIVTSFEILPSNIILSNVTSQVSVNFQTKGDIVNAATIYRYQSSEQAIYLPDAFVLSQCTVSPYDYESLISDITCLIPTQSLPSQIIVFYLQLVIHGQEYIIYNAQLQQISTNSFIQINGPSDNGFVPNVTEFQTSFNENTNTISITYNIQDNDCQFINPQNQIDFIVFSRVSSQNLTGQQNQIPIARFNYSGSFDINLCDLEYYYYSYQVIGIYISINSTITGVKYQFPFELLVQLDSNKQIYNVNNALCDYSPPRLIDTDILEAQSIYDTTYESYNISLYYDITDDVSGFNELQGFIRLNDPLNSYFAGFTLTSSNLLSGNLRNGRYLFNFTLPQYSNGEYQFGIYSLSDNGGNSRPFTPQNTLLITGDTPYSVNAYSATPDRNLPVLGNVTNNYQNNSNTLTITVQGSLSAVRFIPLSNQLPQVSVPILHQFSSLTIWEIPNYSPNTVNTGTYYFGICLDSLSLSSICYSFLDLESMNLINSIEIYNPTTYFPPISPILHGLN